MLETLRAHPHVGNLRGRGMMSGIELVKDKARGEEYRWEDRYGHRVALAARRRGVNTRALGNLVLVVPPLTIKTDEIDLLGRVLRESIDEVCL
jgi:adenosylmethionine-8-amino-7-oxononanoate aminotransferase